MKLNYYEFPETASAKVMIANGCEIVLKNGNRTHVGDYATYMYHIDEVDHIDRCIGGLSVTGVKNLIRQYGGRGWTDHCDRDGRVFEMTQIRLSGNNSRFRYNRHL